MFTTLTKSLKIENQTTVVMYSVQWTYSATFFKYLKIDSSQI